MKKIYGIIAALIILLSATAVCAADDDYFLRPDSFDSLGTWNAESSEGAFGDICLKGRMDTNASETQPAVVTINVTQSGEYAVWARSRDFDTITGSRRFKISVNGALQPFEFGAHGINGWKWEKGFTIQLESGENTIELVDSRAYFARVDGVFLTRNLLMTPPESYADMLKIKRSSYPLESRLEFPSYARENGVISNFYELKNSKTNITFYSVTTSGGTVIQKRTVLSNNGNVKTIEKRGEGFGYLLLYAESSSMNTKTGMFPIWTQRYEYNGTAREMVTNNIYKTGYPVWLIPTTITKTAAGGIVMTATSDYADLTIEWTLGQNDSEPKVTTTLTPKISGCFSLGAFNGNEKSREETDFVLNPFRIHSNRFTEEAVMVTEAFSSAALTQMTYNDLESGITVTKGLAADPESLPFRWVYSENPKFGLTTMSFSGRVQPALFAPVFGTDESCMEIGESFSFSYRPVSVEGGWYNGYIHTVNDIFKLTDYRKNNESSLTQAAFNMLNLLKNDWYSGWDSYAKTHYNMEGRNISTNSDPLAYLQFYLLTEDKELYERRTIPNLANLLSRKEIHFRYSPDWEGSSYYFRTDGIQSDLGGGLPYGTATYTGAYNMTMGLMPRLRITGGADSGTPVFRNGGQLGTVSLLSEMVWLYRYTNDPAHLDAAKAEAQKYINDKVYAKQTVLPQEAPFINLSYFPYWAGLLDLYEVTGDSQYLDAAVEGARWHMTTIWTQPLVLDTTIDINGQEAWELGSFRQGSGLFWHGDKRFRLGIFNDFVPEGTYPQATIADKTVPAWVPSRVGLGIEQTTTFRGSRNSNIIMTTWAPDFLRLAEYTGDEDFEKFARISQIGRYANYPGYYQNSHDAFNISADYPYVGPDFSSIYYHHIPILLSQVQDYLITQAWKWSGSKISFPSVRQQGYVWFNSRHYGFKAGSFFDEKDMWLWFKEGLISADSKQIDWIAARRDGRFAAALMNEDSTDITVNIKLGAEVYGNSVITGATVYAADGTASEASVVNNTLTLSVPAKGLVAFAADAPAVKAPNFSKVPFDGIKNSGIGQTEASVKLDGTPARYVKGEVLQIDPDSYFAHVYVTHKSDAVSKVVLKYRIGEGEYNVQETSDYPFEFIVRVNERDKRFEYSVDIYNIEGVKAEDSAGAGILAPLYGFTDTAYPLDLLDFRMYDGGGSEIYSADGCFGAVLTVKNISPLDISTVNIVTAFYGSGGVLEDIKISPKQAVNTGEQQQFTEEIAVPDGFRGSIRLFTMNSLNGLLPLTRSVHMPIN